MAEILFVSKPIEPPWNDGSKTMVRDLAGAMTRHAPIVLGTRGGSFAPRGARVERIYPRDPGHSLGALAGARVLARLSRGREHAWHFFFQPSPRSSRAARALARARRMPVVHTVASAPAPELDPRALLFADRTVVLSRRTERILEAAGVPGLVRIPPPVAALTVPGREERERARTWLELPDGAPLIVFPGDLERGEGAACCLDALASNPGAILALAYRHKSARTLEAESALRARAARIGVATRTRFVGETDRIHALLGAADVVVLPSTDLGAKVDLPIVLIEAMWMARPVIVARGSAAEELAEGAGALAIEPAALAAELARLIDDRAACAALGQRAVAAAERHEPAAVAAAYEALYDEVLSR